MVFELVIVNKLIEGLHNPKNESMDYVRWKNEDNIYVGLALKFETMRNWVTRNSSNKNFNALTALNNLEDDRLNLGTLKRYFFILEASIVISSGRRRDPVTYPTSLTIFSDNYAITFNNSDLIKIINTQANKAIPLVLGAYNDASTNPFGRYDNSPNDPERYFIFEEDKFRKIADDYINSLRPNPILTRNQLLLKSNYEPSPQTNQTCSISYKYATDIARNAIIQLEELSGEEIFFVQRIYFTNSFIKKESKKEVITNATIMTLKTSAVFGRPESQKSVMNNNSANDVAGYLGIKYDDLDYEWLHLSAFSFGKPTNLDTAQSMDNLVLGTSAANSQMLLFETQIQNMLRIDGGVYDATINVVADYPVHIYINDDTNGYVSWYVEKITYNVKFSPSGGSVGKKRRLRPDLQFSVVFNPFQTVTPTVAEQLIVKALITDLRNTFDQNKQQKTSDDIALASTLSPSLQRLLVRRPSKPVPHQLESVSINLFGRTDVPAIRETRHQTRLTTVDTPYMVQGNQPFSFAQLFGNVLEGTSWLCFNKAQFTVREEDDQVYLEFDGDLIMDPPSVPDLDPDQELARQALIAFKGLLDHATGDPGYEITTLTVGGGLLLKNEITSLDDLLNTPDPSYIDLSAAATFTLPLIPDHESTQPVNSSIVLTNLGLEVTIFRKINLMNLGEGINALNLPEDWTTWVFLSGAVEFHNLNSPEPVVLQAELRYTSENIMVNASVSGVQNLFGLEALSFDYLGAQFVYGQDPEVALSAIYTPFAKSFEFGGIMSSAGVGIYCNAEEFDLNDINDIFNNLTGADLHLPDWDMTFENVRISLATADNLVIGPETLNRGLFISATVRIRDYAASVIGELTPNGVYFEGLVTEMVENLPHTEGLTINSLRLIIDLNKTASDFWFSGGISYSGLTLDCSVHVEKEGETWNETLFADLHGPSFALSDLFPINHVDEHGNEVHTILDTLRFSDAAIIISSYAGTYYKGDTLYNVSRGVQLKCTLEEIPFISTLIHSRQIGLQLSAELGGAINRLGITMPQSTALQLGNAVRCEPFSIYAYLTPTPNLILDFGFSLINIPNQDPLRFDLTLDVGVAEAEAAATMTGRIDNFMGITGLNVADLGLEVGIIYEQFAVSGIPSELALTAKAQDIGMQAAFALKISENPDEEIMYLHVGDVSVNTLVTMIEAFVPQIGTVQVPNFLTINDMTLYCAPMGGQIGVLKFEPGMNFSASLILGGTAVDILAYFSKNGYTDASGTWYPPGLYASGKVERFTLGPVTVTGLKGQDAEVSLAISGATSQLHVDCAIGIYNTLCGGYLDINSTGATFQVKLVIKDILFIDFEVSGNRHLSEFSITATLNNNFNNYLMNLIINKLNQGFAYLEHDIDELQHKVDEAKDALDRVFDEAKSVLDGKEQEVQEYLTGCQDRLRDARNHMDQEIQHAMDAVKSAKAGFDGVFDGAKQRVLKAQNDFDSAMRGAEENMENKRREFDARMINAQKDLEKAQRNCDAALGNAIAAVTAARNKVDGLNRDKSEAQKQVDDSHWYSVGYYEAKLHAIEATILIAEGILSAAIDVLSTIQEGIDKTLEAAQSTFNHARSDADKLIQDAETALDDVRKGTEYGLLQTAQQALSAIETGADYTVWKAAELALEGVRKVEQDLIDAAQYAIDNIAETAVYHAFKLAEDALTAVQNGPLALAYNAATAALTAVNQDLDAMNWFADQLVADGLGAFQINYIHISDTYSGTDKNSFNCTVQVTVLNYPPNIYSMSLDLTNLENFAKHIYDTVISRTHQMWDDYKAANHLT
jgi:hypothetical protein